MAPMKNRSTQKLVSERADDEARQVLGEVDRQKQGVVFYEGEEELLLAVVEGLDADVNGVADLYEPPA